MLMLPVPSATFDERLIQRSGSGETDNASSNASSGLATPRDEDIPPLGGILDLKRAVKEVTSDMMRHSSVGSRKEGWVLGGTSPNLSLSGRGLTKGRVGSIPPVIMSRMMSSASGSSLSQSPEFEDPQVTHTRAKGMYNMPNRHISIEIQEEEGEGASNFDDFRTEDFVEKSKGLDAFFNRTWTMDLFCKSVLRVLLFLPWCIAVGGSIVLCPKGLDIITFHSGYLDPLFGIYRFAHWADHAFDHIVIFVSFLGIFFWFAPAVGILVTCAMCALCVGAWYDFRLDPRIPLGEDDRQSVYLSLTRFWMADEFLNFRRVKEGLVLDDGLRRRRRGRDEEEKDVPSGTD